MKDKVAIVTGTRGIGREIALALAKGGADIALIYASNEGAAKAARSEILQTGRRCEIFKCDISSYLQTKDTVEKVLEQFSKVDILINNAGATKDGLILTMTEQDFDTVLGVNLKGAFNMIKHLYRNFMKNRYGRIINITSVAGLDGNVGQANYSAAKAGLIGLTKTVAKELAGRNVTCNAIAPGFIDTDMTSILKEEIKAAALDRISLKRMGTAAEIAALAAFLASEKASYITGQVIRADGGLAL